MVGISNLNGFPDTVGNGWSYGFMNLFKLIPTVTYPDPGAINANGYPSNGTLASNITWSSWFLPIVYGTGSWVLTWSGTGSVRLDFGDVPTIDSNTGTTTCSVAGNNLTVTGTNVRVVLHFAGGTPFSNGGRFNSGQTFTNLSDMVFCKAASETRIANGEIFNDDLIALAQEVNPKTLRLMDWTIINSSLVSQFGYRAPTTAFSYTARRFQPEAWGGTASLTGLAYSCSAPSTWPGLVDGATVQLTGAAVTMLVVTGTVSGTGGVARLSVTGDTTGVISENQWVYFSSSGGVGGNTSGYKVHIVSTGATSLIELVGSTYASNETGYLSYATLAVGASAAKLIIGAFAIRAAAQGGGDAGQLTFVYSSIADAYLVTQGGMSTGVPVEMQVAFCNTASISYWSNIHLSYTNASITSHVTYVRDNLSSALSAFFELSNEVWNPGFGQTNTATILGKYLGFAQGNGRQLFGFLGLRCRQLFETVKTLYTAQSKTNYKCVIAFQAFGSSTSVRDYLLKGTDLVAGLSSGITGTTTLDTFTTAFSGSPQSYNASPNRPIDYAHHMSYATYFQGAQCTWPGSVGSSNYANTMTSGGPVGNTVGLLGAADQYALGDAANITLALEWLDWDFRQGQRNGAAGAPDQSLLGLATIYTTWETVITANFSDAARALISMPPVKIAIYEGGLQAVPPATGVLSDLGFSAGDQTTYGGSGGRINTLLTAYKNSNYFYFLAKDQFDQFMAKTHSEIPGWFNLQGPNEWSLLNGGTYSRETGTPAWKSFDFMKNYNNGRSRVRAGY